MGFFYPLALPPFNNQFNPLFTFFPFFSFFILIPLLGFSLLHSRKQAVIFTYLYGIFAALVQYYWLIYVQVEGVWFLVLLGLVFASFFVGSLYLVSGMIFRLIMKVMPGMAIVVFPAIWVIIDYSRTLGDLAFPWMFIGYALTPLLALAQLASVTGVWGCTYLVVAVNTALCLLIKNYYGGKKPQWRMLPIGFLFTCTVVISVWGAARLTYHGYPADSGIKVALIQPNIDQFHWGNRSLDTSFSIAESLLYQTDRENPDMIVLPESALLCYCNRHPLYRSRVLAWADSIKTPFFFGSLDWESASVDSYYDSYVFNTAFLATANPRQLHAYHKIKLVPFSEGMPFEARFPILSRINLGEADFRRGEDHTIYSLHSGIRAAPFICYETNFPGFVRKRMNLGANVMVNITNDGWFGKSSGPYHHAVMARMRSIENGVSLARAANSGISTFVDPVGRVLGTTDLYVRATITRSIPLSTISTLYKKWGDWFVALCGIISLFLCFKIGSLAIKKAVLRGKGKTA